ncbi:serine hydrolase [Aliikangiella coralliicola]|uniref:Serine hydrolase n=1 Tax=Aliikangiella coralliicola TaxID=2592383 RepID=A0A545UBS8_9GAMM|nr:serine hydrolase [Aliikangiella coralliicola]TQV86922.1 serine hydrolase [Aliikangiella coralliicola]
MKITHIVGAVSLALAVIACGNSSDKKTPLSITKDSVQGIYIKTGYGEAYQIDKKKYSAYQYNQNGCIRTNTGPREELFEDVSDLKSSLDLKTISYRNTKYSTLARNYLDKHNALPAACNAAFESPDMEPKTNFDYFWHAMNDHYAFFAERNINWQSAYDTYAGQVSDDTSDEELLEIFSKMISPFNDAHLWVLDKEGNRAESGHPSRIEQIASHIELIYNVSSEEYLTQLINTQYQIFNHYIQPSTYQQAGGTEESPAIHWGISKDNVGFIFFAETAGFSGENIEHVEKEVDASKAVFDRMMKQLANTDAIIIDNRFNLGGADDVAVAFASHFAKKKEKVLTKYARNKLGTSVKQSFELVPHSTPYTNPVYLVNSELTTSAAEIFSLMLEQLSQVTVLGTASSGALSDILNFSLPNGWLVGLSNEVYENQRGEIFENKGIPADIGTPIYSSSAAALMRQESYDKALKLLNKPVNSQGNQTVLENAIVEGMNNNAYPGLAIALVKNGDIVYAKGFGRAGSDEMEVEKSVTADTAFNLGSTSKLFVGTSAALLHQQNLLALDDQVAQKLGYELSAPEHFNKPITIQHLLTHTSGILDSNFYDCGYYLDEDKSSLTNLISGEEVCPDPVTTNTSEYLQSYLTQGGQYYSEENYITEQQFSPGIISIYSNVATATTAQVLENISGESFPQLSKRLIFTPLNMDNTAWFKQDLGEDTLVATRYAWLDGEYQAIPDFSLATYADGGLKSSAADLANFAIEVLKKENHVLSDSAKQIMLTPLYENASTYGMEGIGFNWLMDGDYFGHSGSDPGTASSFILNREKGIGIILLSNGDDDQTHFQQAWQKIHLAASDYLESL